MEASQALNRLAQLVIRLYQKVSVSPTRACRFYPTCSHYAIDALQAKGLWKGLVLSLIRILKCHPWHAGGYDPIHS